jgi:2-amino-4-hydroxy-6-hydroxymethyldihydropteridine diphosphokinase
VILIALGANLPSDAGPPEATLRTALVRLDQRGIKILSVSHFYETPAWPDPSAPPFVNAVAVVETGLQPVELLSLLHGVETDLGRMRSVTNAPRTLDIDLLDHDGAVMTGTVTLPHPRIAERSFVLKPLCDIAPDWRHPVSKQTAADLLAELPDRNVPKRID